MASHDFLEATVGYFGPSADAFGDIRDPCLIKLIDNLITAYMIHVVSKYEIAYRFLTSERCTWKLGFLYQLIYLPDSLSRDSEAV